MVGGGNIFRGSSWAGCSGLDRSSADYIGYADLNSAGGFIFREEEFRVLFH